MQLALRRGVYGLGDAVGDAEVVDTLLQPSCADGLCTDPVSGVTVMDPSYTGSFDPETGLPVGAFTAPGGSTVNFSSGEGLIAGGPTAAQILSKAALTASQIAVGIRGGSVQAVAPTQCPSGYKYATGACVPGVTQSSSLVSGISNSTLAIVGIGFLALLMMSSGGGRRR